MCWKSSNKLHILYVRNNRT